MAEKDKSEVVKEVGSDVDGTGTTTGDEAKLKLVEAIVNTPDDQLSSMTSLQPNLVVPLAMMEMYDKMFGLLVEDIERFANWQEERRKYIEEREKVVRTIIVEEIKEVQPSEETPDKKGGLRSLFGLRRQAGPILRREMVEVEQEVIGWGPVTTAEEVEDLKLRGRLEKTLLTLEYRLSLYKHRRSVGGFHKMAAVDLAKEEMAMQAGSEEPGEPDWGE